MHGGFETLRSSCTMNVGVREQPEPFSAALTRYVARIAELWTEGLTRSVAHSWRVPNSPRRTGSTRWSYSASAPTD